MNLLEIAFWKELLLLVILCLCSGVYAFPGDLMRVRLRVIDPNGHPVRGAHVVSLATSAVCTTGNDGTCAFDDQIPTRFKITASGFSEQLVTIRNLGQLTPIKLHIKSQTGVLVKDSIEAKAISSEIGSTRTTEQIDKVPVWLRKTDALLPLFPGTIPRPSYDDFGEGISAAGSRTTATNSLLDGMPNRAERRGGMAIQPSLESAAEFKILTSGYSAEFGHTQGAQVLITTRAGSNELHGSIYDYARDRLGGVFGGPIQKDRAYFFFSYEGANTNFDDPLTSTIPKRSQLQAPNISSLAQKLLPLLPASSTGNVTNEGEHSIDRQYILRLDQVVSANSSLSARVARQQSAQVLFPNENAELPQYWPPVKDNSDSAVLSWTRVRSRDSVLLRASFLDSLGSTLSTCHYNAAYSVSLGNGSNTLGCPMVEIEGYQPFGDGPKLYMYRARTGEFGGTWSATHGPDTLKVGAFANLLQYSETDPTEQNGYLYFSGRFSGSPINDFLQGTPTLALRDFTKAQQRGELRQTGFSSFFQNTLKIGGRLSIDAGIRLDFRPAMAGPSAQFNNFWPSLGAVVNGSKRPPLQSQGFGFDPRFGLSWQPFHNTTIRGGVGQYSGVDLLSTVLGQLTSASSRYGVLTSAAGSVPSRNPIWTPVNISIVRGIDPRNLLMRSYQYSLALEQKLGSGPVLEFAYIASRGIHLGRLYNINMPLPTGALNSTGTPITKRTFPNFNDIIYEDQHASSRYNSARISINQHTGNFLDLSLSYTFSKSIDDSSETYQANFSEAPYAQDVRHLERERGYSDFDHRHQLTGYMSMRLDRLRHGPLLRRSEFAAVVSILSGPRYTLVTGGDLTQRPDVISDPFSNVPRGYYFNPAAFQAHIPTAREPNYFGDSPRNAMIGPAFSTIDLAFNKGFRIASRGEIRFRVECFNILDRKVPFVENILSYPSFGKAANYLNEGRHIVAGARFAF